MKHHDTTGSWWTCPENISAQVLLRAHQRGSSTYSAQDPSTFINARFVNVSTILGTFHRTSESHGGTHHDLSWSSWHVFLADLSCLDLPCKAVVLQEPEKVKSCPPAVKQQLVKLTKRSQKAKSEGWEHPWTLVASCSHHFPIMFHQFILVPYLPSQRCLTPL